MPFIVGVIHSSLEEIKSMPTEELLIVDCDDGQFLQKPERHSFLTEEMRSFLADSLTRTSAKMKKSMSTSDSCGSTFLI